MKASQLIENLKDLVEMYGDLPVYLSESRCDEKLITEGPTQVSSIILMDHSLRGLGFIAE